MSGIEGKYPLPPYGTIVEWYKKRPGAWDNINRHHGIGTLKLAWYGIAEVYDIETPFDGRISLYHESGDAIRWTGKNGLQYVAGEWPEDVTA